MEFGFIVDTSLRLGLIIDTSPGVGFIVGTSLGVGLIVDTSLVVGLSVDTSLGVGLIVDTSLGGWTHCRHVTGVGLIVVTSLVVTSQLPDLRQPAAGLHAGEAPGGTLLLQASVQLRYHPSWSLERVWIRLHHRRGILS